MSCAWVVVILGDGLLVIASITVFVLSSNEVAVRWSVTGAVSGPAGALYVTEVFVTLLSVPALARLHVTPRFIVSCVRLIIKFWLCPGSNIGWVPAGKATTIGAELLLQLPRKAQANRRRAPTLKL